MRKIRRIPDAMRICLLEEIHPKLRALPPGRQALVALYARGLRIRLWLGRRGGISGGSNAVIRAVRKRKINR